MGEKKTLGDFYFESGCHDNTTPHNKKADDTTFSRLGTWKQNFFQRQACFKNWQHWSSTTIPSIWHLSVGGLRVGPISSTGAYEAMSLLLLILRATQNLRLTSTFSHLIHHHLHAISVYVTPYTSSQLHNIRASMSTSLLQRLKKMQDLTKLNRPKER